jgi:hypothetical protein
VISSDLMAMVSPVLRVGLCYRVWMPATS